ncbi:Caltractin [Symbiodinium sp. CCMP2592]|nr:Caltractin [Symbiodinium sp. CCMP2592]
MVIPLGTPSIHYCIYHESRLQADHLRSKMSCRKTGRAYMWQGGVGLLPSMPRCLEPTRLGPSQTAIAGAGREQVRTLYYSTTTAGAFSEKDPRDIAAARVENFIDVHGIGQRSGKYLKHQKKRAPLLDRSSVGYYADYIALPLDDAPVTKALAKENKLRSNPQHSRRGLGYDAASFWAQKVWQFRS